MSNTVQVSVSREEIAGIKAEATAAGIVQSADATKPAETQAPVKPEWVPEKFWKEGKIDEEGLAKSYTELEQKLSKPSEKKLEDKKDEKSGDENEPDADKKEEGEDEKETTPPTEADVAKFSEEFAKEGKLSEDSYKALSEKHGLSKSYVDAYIQGQQALAELNQQKMHGLVGGTESYTEMTKWAGENLSKSEIAAFDKAVLEGDEAQVSFAIKGLHAQFQAANGQAPKEQVRGESRGSAVKPFGSMQEASRAASDPRYAKDPAYRQEVADRLAVSNI
jgi:hypothetical protein